MKLRLMLCKGCAQRRERMREAIAAIRKSTSANNEKPNAEPRHKDAADPFCGFQDRTTTRQVSVTTA